MNLVAKEGPIVNLRDGVVVLSRTAGAFQQMGKASIPTSPTDVHETARALYKALMLPSEERRIKAAIARQIVERQDLNIWLLRQISDVNELLDRLPTRIPRQESVAGMSAVSVG
jgi:trehalose 6-phosphate synthase